MTFQKPKLLYIEISTAHTEIIPAFIEGLYQQYEVTLLINEKSFDRLSYLQNKIKIRVLQEATYLKDIIRSKKEIQPQIILLNSSQGRKVRDLCLRLFFDRVEIIGVHHNPENILKSFTQKMIHFKIKKYIVLADFIKTYLLENNKNRSLKFESFYPLVRYTQGSLKDSIISKQFYYISLPGVLEQDRRDYFGLLELIARFNKDIDKRIKFVFLGNSKNHDGPKILETIHRNGILDRFVLFDHYVEDEVMSQYIEQSISVMPLIHPGIRWFQQYFETKISGAYNLSYTYNKVLLMHEIFKSKSEFVNYASYYNSENFAEVVNLLISQHQVKKDIRFSIDVQNLKLQKFIEPIL